MKCDCCKQEFDIMELNIVYSINHTKTKLEEWISPEPKHNPLIKKNQCDRCLEMDNKKDVWLEIKR